MKYLVVLCALASLAAAYYEKLDKVEVEPIVNDPVAMKAFVSYFLDKSTCNELTSAFEEVHLEILDTRCSRCSPKLRHSVRRFFEELPKVHPDKFVEYQTRFGEERVDSLVAAVANA